jgi:hypothetical protein
MTATLAQLITTHQIDVLDHLDRQVNIPTLTGPQRQGDVFIIPLVRDHSQDNPIGGTGWHRVPGSSQIVQPATTPVPAAGVPVVRGENGGNTHAIVGRCFCDVKAATATNLTLAILTVPDGDVAYLAHPEHGYNGIGPGTYELRRQREQADELRLVQD